MGEILTLFAFFAPFLRRPSTVSIIEIISDPGDWAAVYRARGPIRSQWWSQSSRPNSAQMTAT